MIKERRVREKERVSGSPLGVSEKRNEKEMMSL